jgi:hypothetical protein
MNLAIDGCEFTTHEVKSTSNQITLGSRFAILRVNRYWEYKARNLNLTRKLRIGFYFIDYSQLTFELGLILALRTNLTIDLGIGIKEVKRPFVLLSRSIANLSSWTRVSIIVGLVGC